jgi:hypothetical protein
MKKGDDSEEIKEGVTEISEVQDTGEKSETQIADSADSEAVKVGGKSGASDEDTIRVEFDTDNKENINEEEKIQKKRSKASKNSTYRRMLEAEERQQSKKVTAPFVSLKFVYI